MSLLDPRLVTRIDAVLASHELTRHDEPWPVDRAMRQESARVDTDRGACFVRQHRSTRTLEQILAVERLVRIVEAHGLPVVPALQAPDGAHVHQVDGRLFTVTPWVEGQMLQRGNIAPDSAATLGAMQGRVHAALLEEPASRGAQLGDVGPSWESEVALERMSELARVLDAQPSLVMRAVRKSLDERRALLERGSVPAAPEHAPCASQLVHGDYHDGNLIVDNNGAPRALVGWDRAGLAPRAFHLGRALLHSTAWAPRLASAWCLAYRDSTALERSECAWAARTLWHQECHEHWALWGLVVEGDERLRPYVEQDARRWVRMREPSFREEFGRMLGFATA